MHLTAGTYKLVTGTGDCRGRRLLLDTVTLNVGRADGVAANETVLNGNGLVGTVTSVTAGTATVQLLTDAATTVGIRAGGGQIGALSGTARSLSGSAPLKLTMFATTAALRPGEEIVTFGSVGGRPYVPGVPGRHGVHRDHPARLAHPHRRGQAVRRLHRTGGSRRGGLPVMAGAVTPETGPSVVRRVVTTLVLAVALFAAVVVQLTVLNRLPWPGAAAPDLVLLLVAAIAVGTGPAAGAVSGFCGGLALDTAPPAAHYAGEYALVFALVGYCAAKVVRLPSGHHRRARPDDLLRRHGRGRGGG